MDSKQTIADRDRRSRKRHATPCRKRVAPERTLISYALTISLAGITSLTAAFHMLNRGLLCLTPCRL